MYKKKGTCKFALFDATQWVEPLSNGAFLFLLTLDLKIKIAINLWIMATNWKVFDVIKQDSGFSPGLISEKITYIIMKLEGNGLEAARLYYRFFAKLHPRHWNGYINQKWLDIFWQELGFN